MLGHGLDGRGGIVIFDGKGASSSALLLPGRSLINQIVEMTLPN
jgi:hypothetical protein